MELPAHWWKALQIVNARLKELGTGVAERGLDGTVEELEALLIGVWKIESQGALLHGEDVPAINRYARAFEDALHKIAPPPPKKKKLDAPPPRLLPLSESHAVRGLDVAMLAHALGELSDFTSQTDKARLNHLFILDDWRRLLWASARISSWERYRALCKGEPPCNEAVPGRKFSRQAALTLLEAVAKYRVDLITPTPAVSMIACQRCGRHDGRERIRCTECSKLLCGRCLAPASGICIDDYAVRYNGIPADVRVGLSTAARAICAQFKLDEYTRNDSFVRALEEHGVSVVFHDDAQEGGDEVVDAKGKRSLHVRNRESGSTKRILFAALARCYMRSVEMAAEPELERYFVDVCMRIPVEEALAPRPA